MRKKQPVFAEISAKQSEIPVSRASSFFIWQLEDFYKELVIEPRSRQTETARFAGLIFLIWTPPYKENKYFRFKAKAILMLFLSIFWFFDSHLKKFSNLLLAFDCVHFSVVCGPMWFFFEHLIQLCQNPSHKEFLKIAFLDLFLWLSKCFLVLSELFLIETIFYYELETVTKL